MNDLPKVTNKNYKKYLRTYLPEIPIEKLEHIYRRGGDSIAFWYGDDRILKVGRNDDSRTSMRFEFELLTYLHQFDHAITLPEPVTLHEESLYVVYKRIDGEVLTPDAVAGFSPEQRSSFAESMGSFLSFLHTHDFPTALTDQMEVEEDTFDVLHRRSLRRLEFLRAHEDAHIDYEQSKADLGRLHDVSHPDLAVIHCDLKIDHVLATRSGLHDFSIIDFADTLIGDRYGDLLRMELPRDLLDMLCEQYAHDVSELENRIEFRNLDMEIGRVYKAVEKEHRQALKEKS
jgi:aminoglycoside phosphotransferase (APT) family kinase protein